MYCVEEVLRLVQDRVEFRINMNKEEIFTLRNDYYTFNLLFIRFLRNIKHCQYGMEYLNGKTNGV